MNQQNKQKASVTTHSIQATYQPDPLAVYQQLAANNKNNLLLESAEIDKKHQLKSLLLLDAALRIECNGNTVILTALSSNGKTALEFAHQQLNTMAKCEANGESSLTVTFEQPATELDEKSRLLANNPFQSLRLFTRFNQQNSHPFAIFLAGVFAFDMISLCEQLPDVPTAENSCPDFVYYLAETLVIIDHEQQSTEIIGNVFSLKNSSKNELEKHHQRIKDRLTELQTALLTDYSSMPLPPIDNNLLDKSQLSVDIDDDVFCQHVENLKDHIRAGDIFQVVPSRSFSLPCNNTFIAYAELKLSNPSPYMFFMNDEAFCIFGASPESAIKYQQSNRQVEIYPIAGTRPRGFTKSGQFSLDLDSRIELDLRLDQKELAEHIMLVDLARNDVARVSQPGTRYVADLLKVDRYSHVMHLVSRVCGTLQNDLDALHAYQACMNMGTLSGAPKIKATELIRQVEGKRRGSYGGAVGYFTGQGDMDTCIVIRSAFVKHQQAYVQAGAGVVYDSDPQSEANETKQKAQAVINAILRANTIASQQQEQGA